MNLFSDDEEDCEMVAATEEGRSDSYEEANNEQHRTHGANINGKEDLMTDIVGIADNSVAEKEADENQDPAALIPMMLPPVLEEPSSSAAELVPAVLQPVAPELEALARHSDSSLETVATMELTERAVAHDARRGSSYGKNQEHLIVSRLVLENFKSYGGRHLIGPFHQKFSSIVGPNGSGKSNIIDALLFVFGRRAMHLRHKKLADLIHRSASLPNLQCAKVSVYFESVISNSTGSQPADEPIPGSSFVISREAFMDGTSRYTINGTTASQKNVTDLLKAKGVDLDHNRFLILQGEVEQIAMMKPKGSGPNEEGLLEYLEDIIGSNKYILQIAETEKALESIAELVQETREKMQSAKTQVDSMKGPLQLAEQVCDVERKLLELKTKVELKAGRSISREVAKAQAAYDDVKAKWADWKTTKNNDKKNIAELDAAAKKQKEVVAKAEKLLKQVEQQFAALERRDNELTAKETHCMKRAQALQKEATKLEADKAKCEALAIELKEQAEKRREEVPLLQHQTEVLTAELELLEKSLEHEFNVLREQKEKADKELQPDVVELGKMQQAVEMIKTESRLIEEKQEVARQQQQKMQEKLNNSQDELAEKRTRLDENQKTTEKLKKTFLKARNGMTILREEFIKQWDEIQQLRQQQELKETQLSESKTGTLIPKILQAKHDGTLHGVVDHLWNLGQVDPSLETAFSAVASADLLLVERTEHAQRVVEFVRQRDLGRVTCIVLDRIQLELTRDLKELRKKRIPDGARLLLDLIQVANPDHEIAFYFVLRDTLLVTTLDEARDVAFGRNQRWRVVTIDGQLIDRSGTMTGGLIATKTSMFKQVGARNPMVAANGARDIEKLKVSIAEKEGKLNSLKDNKARAETDFSYLNQQLHDLDLLRVKLTAEVESGKQDVQYYSKALRSSEIPQLSTNEQQELIRLGDELKKAEVKIGKQQDIVNQKQETVDRVTKAIELVGGEKRRVLKSDVEAMAMRLEKLKKELKEDGIQAEVNRKKGEKLGITIPEKRAEAEAELEAGRACEKSKDEITDEAEKVVRRKEEIEHVLREQREIEKEKLKLLKEKMENSKKDGMQEFEFQTSLQDLDQTLSSHKANFKKHQKLLQKYEEQFNSIPSILNIDREAGIAGEGTPDAPTLQLALTDQELDALDKVLLEVEIQKQTESISRVKVDLSIIEKYRTAAEKLKSKVDDFEGACHQRDVKAKELSQLEFLRLKEFSTGFVSIATAVKELYQMITQEGDAELELADPSNPFTSGIVFSVRPPNKSWKKIQNLSGGEKTLSSLSLVFALHQYRPTPIYFLDEIDAALDHRNVTTIALYVANQAKDAQFIIISLRNHMFELADTLVGIYKTHGSTKTVTIEPDSLVSEEERGAIRCLDEDDGKGQQNLNDLDEEEGRRLEVELAM